MRRGVLVGFLTVVVLAMVAVLVAQQMTRPVPDVRGVVLGGDAVDRERLSPLLDAGFCVVFRYDGTSSEVTGPDISFISDAYFVGDESPYPDWWNRRLRGSTVTVIVRGSDLSGRQVDWDSMPEMCP